MTDQIITFGCKTPECTHDFYQPLTWYKSNDQIVCPSCGHTYLIDSVRFFEEVSLDDPKVLEKFKALVRFKRVNTREMDT